MWRLTSRKLTAVLLASLLAGAMPSVKAQPRLLPEAPRGPLARELAAVEPLVWEDAWRAREALGALEDRFATAADNERIAYHALLAQALIYLHVDDVFAEVVARGVELVEADTPPRLALMLRFHDGVRQARAGAFAEAAVQLRATAGDARAAALPGIATLAQAEVGYAYTLAGRHEAAVEVLQRAYGDAVALGDDFLVAVVNEVFGVLYTYIDEYDRAIRHYRLALDGYEELAYVGYVAEAIYGLATAHRYAGEYDTAVAAFERYGELIASRAQLHGRFTTLYGIGSTFADSGDCKRAIGVIEQALELEGPRDYKAELLKRAAVCHGESGDEPAARDALVRAQDIIKAIPELQGTRWEIGLLESEARMEAALGNHAAAYEAMAAYHQAKTALQRDNTAERRQSRREALEDERQELRIELLQEQARVRSLELEKQRRDLRQQRLLVALLLVAGLVLAVIVLWRVRETRRWRELSTRDVLTGVHNRRHAFARLESLLADLDPARGQLSLLLLDLDDFKTINDRHGHPVGDRVLQAVASALAGLLRPGDELARVGGEEFLLLLPRTGEEGALAVAARVGETIRELAIPSGGGATLRVSASIGVAAVTPARASADALYKAVDAALYRAKTAGKDRIEAAPAD